MSVNIFGSSGSGGRGQSSGVDKKYVDQKFATLSTNLATKVNKNGYLMGGDLNMRDYKICNIRNPQENQEAVNKKYVDSVISQALVTERSLINLSLPSKTYFDTKNVKNSVGFIPDLTSNQKNKSGFIVSASVIQENHHPWYAFNSWKGDQRFQSLMVKEERWIKIKCPESIKIHKFTVRGREGENVRKITDWIFQGSNDNNVQKDLYKGDREFIDLLIY